MYLPDELLKENRFNGFPVIVDAESQMLCGFVSRRDLKIAIGSIQHQKKLIPPKSFFSSCIEF